MLDNVLIRCNPICNKAKSGQKQTYQVNAKPKSIAKSEHSNTNTKMNESKFRQTNASKAYSGRHMQTYQIQTYLNKGKRRAYSGEQMQIQVDRTREMENHSRTGSSVEFRQMWNQIKPDEIRQIQSRM
ncbi:hypothetical protein Tco_1154887 [Tanacetum coccineum]